MLKPLITFALLLAQLSVQASEPLQITVSAVNTGPSPPYRWFNYCSSQWNGSSIQTVRRVFKELDVQVTFDIPIKKSHVYSANFPEKLRTGELDAVLSMPIIPYPGVTYIKTPIIEISLGVFYPVDLGKIKSTEQLQNLPGYYYNRHGPKKNTGQAGLSATRNLIDKWAKQHGLSVSSIEDFKKYTDVIKGGNDHFIIDSKYSTTIDRKKYQLLSADIKLASYYFALADRAPWKDMHPLIEKKIQYIKESGLLALLERANLKRWVSERETNEICKDNFQPQ